ncbi:MAG: hypothetical protein JWR25_1944 [Noviherbaspirillum sp.]|nr:hypothetical protein [Noviherbaspirillum sp.]
MAGQKRSRKALGFVAAVLTVFTAGAFARGADRMPASHVLSANSEAVAPAAASSGLRLAGLPGLFTAPQTGWIPDRLGFSAAACGNSKLMRAELPRACAGARDARLTDG